MDETRETEPTRDAMTTLLGAIGTAVRRSLERDFDDIAAHARAAAVEDVRLVLTQRERTIERREVTRARDAADAQFSERWGDEWLLVFLRALGFRVTEVASR